MRPMTPPPDTAAALDLIARIHAGSEDAWHEFIDLYGDLIYTVIHRYLGSGDDDDRRTVFVDVLDELFRGRLQDFDGRSRMTTWLGILTRSRCIDYLRSVRGRRALPEWTRSLPSLQQRVFYLFFIEGLSGRLLCERLQGEGYKNFDLGSLATVLSQLDSRLESRSRRRLAFDLQARRIGALSGRLLDFFHRAEVESEARQDHAATDAELQRQDAADLLQRIQDFILNLPELERHIIELRYYQEHTARQTAEMLNLEGQRRVYTLEGKALRRLRTLLDA